METKILWQILDKLSEILIELKSIERKIGK